MIVGIIGSIGSGKDSIAEYLLKEHNFKQDSFARSLKDAVANVFNWDRDLLEGKTQESRIWREEPDTWWAERLSIPHLTPRWVLQYWGTEVCRHGFHSDIWLASLEKRLLNNQSNVVISDCRFENEIHAIKALGGKIIHVKRGAPPQWEDLEIAASKGDNDAKVLLESYGVHTSEWAWRSVEPDIVIENNSTFEELYSNVAAFLKL